MHKGLLFLSGGGDPPVSFKFDSEFFSQLNSNSKILYIPVALNRQKSSSVYESCRAWFSELIRKHTENHKHITFDMLTDDYEHTNLKNYDCIFIGGGNTYYLLDFIYQGKLRKELTDFLNDGGIIYGGSAGAMIFGADIRTAEEENDRNYHYHHGFNVIQEKSIICHYNDALDQKVFDVAKKTNTQVIAIPEESGLIVDSEENIVKIINNVYIFTTSSKNKLV